MNLRDLRQALRAQSRYALMRGIARFASVRAAVGGVRSALHRKRVHDFLGQREAAFPASLFTGLDCSAFVARLRTDGIALGLQLPADILSSVRAYAEQNPCFADRKPELGFQTDRRRDAEARLGKPILVAQYFNTQTRCDAVSSLLHDPKLEWIAARYLGSIPTFVGADLWWTFPVKPLEADRDRHAHLFHRDVDDFRFFKFFFYLTPVHPGDGGHVCVVASHRRPPLVRLADRWQLRRYSDAEIESCFAPQRILEVCGPAGSGFAENTLCVHKGRTPTKEPRLLLQLQYALFDYGVMHDRRDPAALQMLC